MKYSLRPFQNGCPSTPAGRTGRATSFATSSARSSFFTDRTSPPSPTPADRLSALTWLDIADAPAEAKRTLAIPFGHQPCVVP